MTIGPLCRLPMAAVRLLDALARGLLTARATARQTHSPHHRVAFYVGRREAAGGAVYAVDDEVRRLAPAPGLTAYWGHPNDGAIALGYRILMDLTGYPPDATCAHRFTNEVIEHLDADGFVLDGEQIDSWLRDISHRYPA